MSVAKMTDHSEQVQYNAELQISLGKSRYEKNWKNKRMLWSVLLSRLSRSSETAETHAEYMKMSKDQQDSLKDIGGFVGGHLKEGKRKTGSVASRQILTLDADFAPKDSCRTTWKSTARWRSTRRTSTQRRSRGCGWSCRSTGP